MFTEFLSQAADLEAPTQACQLLTRSFSGSPFLHSLPCQFRSIVYTEFFSYERARRSLPALTHSSSGSPFLRSLPCQLRSIVYTEFFSQVAELPAPARAPDMFQLVQNLRTHSGIVKLAHSVVEALTRLFPDSVDKLQPETSELSGESLETVLAPVSDRLKNKDWSPGSRWLRGQGGGSPYATVYLRIGGQAAAKDITPSKQDQCEASKDF